MSDNASPPPRSHNIALIISLCVNLLLAGLIAIPLLRYAVQGPMLFHHARPEMLGPPPERMHQMLSPRMLLHIAPEREADIRKVLDNHHGRIEQLRGNSMAARRKVMDLFSAAKFDQAAFDKALAEMRAADTAFEDEILKIASETAAMLSPEERKKAAAFRGHHGMMFMRQEGPGHMRGHGFGPPPPPEEGGQDGETQQ